jgi:hypothetical protein
METLEFRVFCWTPYLEDSILIATFDDLDDAKEFAEKKTETYKKRWYSNRGTFILNDKDVRICEFEKEY